MLLAWFWFLISKPTWPSRPCLTPNQHVSLHPKLLLSLPFWCPFSPPTPLHLVAHSPSFRPCQPIPQAKPHSRPIFCQLFMISFIMARVVLLWRSNYHFLVTHPFPLSLMHPSSSQFLIFVAHLVSPLTNTYFLFSPILPSFPCIPTLSSIICMYPRFLFSLTSSCFPPFVVTLSQSPLR